MGMKEDNQMKEYRDLSQKPTVVHLEEDEVIAPPPPEYINTLCTKCNADNASLEYVGTNYIMSEATLGGNKHLLKTGSDTNETILVTCNICGYQWIEKPLDAAAQHLNNDDPQRHNISGSMNRPAGSFKTEIIEKDDPCR